MDARNIRAKTEPKQPDHRKKIEVRDRAKGQVTGDTRADEHLSVVGKLGFARVRQVIEVVTRKEAFIGAAIGDQKENHDGERENQQPNPDGCV